MNVLREINKVVVRCYFDLNTTINITLSLYSNKDLEMIDKRNELVVVRCYFDLNTTINR